MCVEGAAGTVPDWEESEAWSVPMCDNVLQALEFVQAWLVPLVGLALGHLG